MLYETERSDKKKKTKSFALMMNTGGIKREEGECSYKDVKKEDEETDETPGRVEIKIRQKKTEETKTFKKKMKRKKVKNGMERGESSRGVELKVMKKKAEVSYSSKKMKIKSNKVGNGVPEFKITIRKSYLKFLVRFKTNDLTEQYTIVSVLM